jgi:hypothetical protein
LSATSCTVCGAGRYSSTVGASSSATCIECSSGNYSLSSSTTCTVCGTGTHSASAGSSSCAQCLAGNYLNSTLSLCLPCPPGSFKPVAGAYLLEIEGATCQSSLKTRYQYVQLWDGKPAYVSVDRTKFLYRIEASGSWMIGDGPLGSTIGRLRYITNTPTHDVPASGWQESCSGSWVPSALTARDAGCALCGAASYADAAAASFCTSCLAGEYSALIGASSSSSCTTCASGKLSVPNQTVCVTQCPAGSYANGPGCVNCESGRYSNAVGATSSATCVGCDRGKYSAAAGASSAATCVDCSAGKYSNATGVSACLLCGVGKYGPLLVAPG